MTRTSARQRVSPMGCVLVLAPDGTLELAGGVADQWLDALGAGSASTLPIVIQGVADRAPSGGGALGTARVRTMTGHWLVVRGTLLGNAPDARVGIQLESALAPELTELVARGHTTNEIAARLRVAPYTVQDHLKSIFERSGTASRGELVARLFVDHYLRMLAPPDSSEGL